MATVNGEVEVEVVRIDGVDTFVLLGIVLAICTGHHHLNVCRTIAIIRHSQIHFGTIHCLEPCSPVTLTATWCASCVTITPTIVVGTYDSILLASVRRAEHNHEVVPVVDTTGVVGEAGDEALLRSNLDVLRVSTPEWCTTIRITNGGIHLVDHIKRSIADNRLWSGLTFISLSIDGYEGLGAQTIHIRNSLEGQVGSGNGLRYTLLELNSGGDISQNLLEVSILLHLLGHTIQRQRQWLFVFL